MISAIGNSSITAARGEVAGASAPTDAEKTARLNVDLAARLEKIRAHAANFLDENRSLKERLQGLMGFQSETITIGKSFEAAGIPLARGLDPNDQVQAGYMREVLEISNRVWGSGLVQRASAINGASGYAAGKAVAEGKPPGLGALAHWDSLSVDEQDLAFALTNLVDRSGARRYSSKEQYRAEFARDVAEQQRLMAGPSVGGPSRAERLALANDMMRQAAGDYKAWQASRGNAGFVVDTISLSLEGAKAAAETLTQTAPADGTTQAQLKALETLKQVSAQHREWLASMEERETEQAERLNQTDLTAPLQPAQPGTRLSVAA